MKFRLFILVQAVLFCFCFTYCSKKEARSLNQSTLSYEVNGMLVQCDVISVGQGTGMPGDISVDGTVSTDADKGISLSIDQDGVGDSALYVLFLRHNNQSWGGSTDNPYAVVNVSVNNAEKVKGTFSGEYVDVSMPSRRVMITNGSFEVFR